MKEEKRVTGEPFFPHQVLREAFAGTLLVASIVLLASFLPASLLGKADPFVTPSPIFPEWYFMAMFGFLKFWVWDIGPLSGKIMGVLLPGIAIGFLFLLPFLDRSPERHPFRRPLFTAFVLLLVAMAVYFAYFAIKITLEHAKVGG